MFTTRRRQRRRIVILNLYLLSKYWRTAQQCSSDQLIDYSSSVPRLFNRAPMCGARHRDNQSPCPGARRPSTNRRREKAAVGVAVWRRDVTLGRDAR